MISNDFSPVKDEWIQRKICEHFLDYWSAHLAQGTTAPRQKESHNSSWAFRQNIHSCVFPYFNVCLSCLSHVVGHTPGMSPGVCSPCWGPRLWQSGSLWWASSDHYGWTWRPTLRRWSQRRRSGRWGPRAPQTLEMVGQNKGERGRGGSECF